MSPAQPRGSQQDHGLSLELAERRQKLLEDPAIQTLLRRVHKDTKYGDRTQVTVDNVRIWPLGDPETRPTNSQGKDLLSAAPPEVLFKIASLLDDVGYVCFRNAHRNIRNVLSIDSLSIKPAHKYIM